MTERFWLDEYPEVVPHEIKPDKYPSLIEFLEDSVRKFEGNVAFENMGEQVTFHQLDEMSTALANYLLNETKLQPGDRVAIQMPNVLQYPIALFGVLKAGMIIVNTNPMYKPSEMKHQFNDSGARGIIILNTFAYKLEEIISATPIETVIIAEIGDMLGTFKGALVDFAVKRVKKMVPSYKIEGTLTYKQVFKKGRKYAYQKPDLRPDHLAILQYTGGTTGVAKGAALTHQNILANIEQVAAWMKPKLIDGQEITITAIPLYHVFALTVNCFGMIKIGARNILITDPRNMPDFIATLKKYKFSVITGVNTLFNGLLQRPAFKDVDFGNLKVTVAGGMALQTTVYEKWKEVTGNEIVEGYGLSETSPLLCCNPIDGNHRLGTIGLPVPGTQIKVVSDDGETLPPGEYGEIWAKGPQVMSGYWNKSDETALVMEDGWFKTGDIAFFSHDGYLKIVDRKKEMIIVGGMKVYPNEVENAISQIEGVLEAGVIGVDDKKTGEAVKAYVVVTDESVGIEEIMYFCRKNLVSYKVPKFIDFIKELPKSNVGKILRKELRREHVSKINKETVQ